MHMQDNPKTLNKWLVIIVFLILILLILNFISLIYDFCKRDVVCEDSCGEPQIFALNSFAYNKMGELVTTPYSKLLIKDENGDLVAHGDEESVFVPEAQDYVDMKRRDLIEECFSTYDYRNDVKPLSQVRLTEHNTTITVLNMDETGRLESYDLVDAAGGIPEIISDIFDLAELGNYTKIQTALSGLNRLSVTPDTTGNIRVKPRPIPGHSDKTPYYKKFETSYQGGSDGHVVFYVLADQNLKFNEALPVIAHTAEANIGELFSPYFKYDILAANLQVMPLHFKRGGTMSKDPIPGTNKMALDCRYPYDLGVVSNGQSINTQDTPLLIDPEMGSDGLEP